MSKRLQNIIAPDAGRNKARERREMYRRAFVEIMGDPFALDEPEGFYNMFKSRGELAASKNDFDTGRGVKNPAQPSMLDFFCDVEIIVEQVIKDKRFLKRFYGTYILGDKPSITSSEQQDLEQRIGRLFMEGKISPVAKYFRTIRRPRG